MQTARPDWCAEVEGADALFDWFGYWPDFHDAEILDVHLDRSGTSSCRLHTWEWGPPVSSSGHFSRQKEVMVTFLLDDVEDLELYGFSAQNVISGAELKQTSTGYQLTLGPCYGLAGSVTAAKLRIRIEPHAARGTNA